LAVAGVLFAAALARLTLPERSAGMLASRSRLTDVAILTALGTGLLVAGLMLPVQP
jgi:multisubunit Na+/H+ antiporter MnhB subunit